LPFRKPLKVPEYIRVTGCDGVPISESRYQELVGLGRELSTNRFQSVVSLIGVAALRFAAQTKSIQTKNVFIDNTFIRKTF